MSTLGNISTSDVTGLLMCLKLFPSPVVLENFAEDQGFKLEQDEFGVTRKGIDGKMVYGNKPVIYKVTLSFEASAPANGSLNTLESFCRQNPSTTYVCDLNIYVPSINTTYVLTNGVLVNGILMPEIKYTLQPTTWNFHFQDYSSISGNTGF